MNTTLFLSAEYSDVNPNAVIAFVLDESFFGAFNWFMNSTMAVSNVNVAPTPIPGAVWLLDSGLLASRLYAAKRLAKFLFVA